MTITLFRVQDISGGINSIRKRLFNNFYLKGQIEKFNYRFTYLNQLVQFNKHHHIKVQFKKFHL